MRGLLVLVHLPADDLAAEGVLHQVESIEGPTDRRGQVGDIPRVNLIGSLGLESLRLGDLSGHLRAATPMLLVGLTQHPVEGRFRGQVFAVIGQPRHDLRRWQALVGRRVAYLQDPRTLFG